MTLVPGFLAFLPSVTRLLVSAFRWVKQQSEFAKQAQNPDTGPKLDLGFKEGQTIKINIAVRLKEPLLSMTQAPL